VQTLGSLPAGRRASPLIFLRMIKKFMQKIKLQIKGIRSISRSGLIENKLKDFDGVAMVKVNNESGKAVVIYDENKIEADKIKRAVEKAGDYKVEIIAEEREETEDKTQLEKENKKEKSNLSSNISLIMGIVAGVCIISVILNIVLLITVFNK